MGLLTIIGFGFGIEVVGGLIGVLAGLGVVRLVERIR
jgi:hypothetical protein